MEWGHLKLFQCHQWWQVFVCLHCRYCTVSLPLPFVSPLHLVIRRAIWLNDNCTLMLFMKAVENRVGTHTAWYAALLKRRTHAHTHARTLSPCWSMTDVSAVNHRAECEGVQAKGDELNLGCQSRDGHHFHREQRSHPASWCSGQQPRLFSPLWYRGGSFCVLRFWKLKFQFTFLLLLGL